MKKKVIITVLSVNLLFAGVVSAASIWGSYKGNDIIRITSNGVALRTTDVPAISYNGRTMIPINMLDQVGVGYNWDQANKTVDVRLNNNSTDSIKSSIKYADYFHSLEVLGKNLDGLNSYYLTVASSVTSNNADAAKALSDVNNYLNKSIADYNILNEQFKNYTDSDITYVLQCYYDAIDYLKLMDTSLSNYHLNKNQKDFNSFTNSSQLASKVTLNGISKATTKYQLYISLALNSK